MKQKGKAGYLFRLYRKRTSSLLLNLYKAGITGNVEDIHKTRTDIKKIHALYNFLAVSYQGDFSEELHYKILRGLFGHAGRLRELNVNLILLERHATGAPGENEFRLYLEQEERVSSRKFLHAIRAFDEKQILIKEKDIGKFLDGISGKNFSGNVDKFIRKKSDKILGYLPGIHNPVILHKIRISLKSISSILEILRQCSNKPDKTEQALLSEITGAEVLIGVWHDHMVFFDAIHVFRKMKSADKSSPPPVLESIESKLTLENIEIVDRLEKMITSLIVETILSQPRWNRDLIEIPPRTRVTGAKDKLS
jgi:CHAD domain-containing protein